MATRKQIMSAKQLAERTFVRIKDGPPTAQEQAKLFFDAMKAYMSKEIVMTVEEVEGKFSELTGEIKNSGSLKANAVVGRMGEVVFSEAVEEYFKIDEIRERYGMYVIEGSARVLIPADALKAKQSRNILETELKSMERRVQNAAFKEWKQVMGKSESQPDFLMKNAFPMEIKSKLNSYTFIGDSKSYKPSDRSRLSAENKHLKKIAKEGGKLVVGGIWIDTIWEDMLENVTKPLSKEFLDMERFHKDWNAKAKSKMDEHDATLMYDVSLPAGQGKKYGEGRLFKMVGLRLQAFIPFAANERDLKKAFEKEYFKRADMDALKVATEYSSEVMIQVIHRNLQKLMSE